MKQLAYLFIAGFITSCAILQESFCYFGQCIAISELHPNPVDENVFQSSKEKAESMGIDPMMAIEPIVEDILRRDGNYGLPSDYDYPKHHYHFYVFGDEIDLSKYKEKYPKIVELHSGKNCPKSEEDTPTFTHFSTFNRLYKSSYIFGYRGLGADGYGIVRYEPNHIWKKWPELIETGITVIYN